MNMIKLVWCTFQECFGTFTMLLVEMSSETRLFSDLSDYVFEVCNFGNTKSTRVLIFFKRIKFYCKFQQCSKKFRKSFCFWDNCIWIGIVKLSLLRREYFSFAANMLRSSPKILHVNRRDFFQLNWLGSDQWVW